MESVLIVLNRKKMVKYNIILNNTFLIKIYFLLELRNKYDQDPKSFIIERTDPNKSMVNKSNLLSKSTMD